MKAEIDVSGNLVLIPETTTEGYALKGWMEENEKKTVGLCDSPIRIQATQPQEGSIYDKPIMPNPFYNYPNGLPDESFGGPNPYDIKCSGSESVGLPGYEGANQ